MSDVVLGCYAGAADGHNPSAMAATKAAIDKFRKLMNKPIKYYNIFQAADFSNPGGSVWDSAQSGTDYLAPASGVIPVIGLPMAPTGSNNAACWGNCDLAFKNFVAGAYDAFLRSNVDQLAMNGYKEADFRIGYEFNGNFMAWGVGNSGSATVVDDFIAAWRHIATILRDEGAKKGVKVNTVWNPAAINFNTICPTKCYPGNDYVDKHGLDCYSPSYELELTNWTADGKPNGASANKTAWAAIDSNRAHFFQYQDGTKAQPTGNGGGWSFADAIAFAKQCGKQLVICECGAGGNGADTGPIDDPIFPQSLQMLLTVAGAMGVSIGYVSIWPTKQSDGDWGFLDGQKPKEAAAWAQYLGATTKTLTLKLSEDAATNAGVTDAIAVVKIDGVVVWNNAVTASHAAGQAQAVTLQVASGDHVVEVDFTNDFDRWVSGAYSSKAGDDRNLYLLSANANGVDAAQSAHAFNSNGSYQFRITV